MSGVVWWPFIITLGHLGFEPLSTFENISILQVSMEDTLYYLPTAAMEEAALRSPFKSGPTAGRSVAKRQLLQPRDSHSADTQATLSRGCSHLRPDYQPKRKARAWFFLPIGGCFRGGPCAPKLSISLAGTDSEPRCGRGPLHAALLLQLFFPLAGVWMPSLLTPASPAFILHGHLPQSFAHVSPFCHLLPGRPKLRGCQSSSLCYTHRIFLPQRRSVHFISLALPKTSTNRSRSSLAYFLWYYEEPQSTRLFQMQIVGCSPGEIPEASVVSGVFPWLK